MPEHAHHVYRALGIPQDLAEYYQMLSERVRSGLATVPQEAPQPQPQPRGFFGKLGMALDDPRVRSFLLSTGAALLTPQGQRSQLQHFGHSFLAGYQGIQNAVLLDQLRRYMEQLEARREAELQARLAETMAQVGKTKAETEAIGAGIKKTAAETKRVEAEAKKTEAETKRSEALLPHEVEWASKRTELETKRVEADLAQAKERVLIAQRQLEEAIKQGKRQEILDRAHAEYYRAGAELARAQAQKVLSEAPKDEDERDVLEAAKMASGIVEHTLRTSATGLPPESIVTLFDTSYQAILKSLRKARGKEVPEPVVKPGMANLVDRLTDDYMTTYKVPESERPKIRARIEALLKERFKQ